VGQYGEKTVVDRFKQSNISIARFLPHSAARLSAADLTHASFSVVFLYLRVAHSVLPIPNNSAFYLSQKAIAHVQAAFLVELIKKPISQLG
jgi:hypothetical protein